MRKGPALTNSSPPIGRGERLRAPIFINRAKSAVTSGARRNSPLLRLLGGAARRIILAFWFSLLHAVQAQSNSELPPGVELHEYTGWPSCLLLNASELPVQTVVVPAVGGRIVHYSLNGQNILLENSTSQGAILGPRNEDLYLGGYQCDVGPGEGALPPHWILTEAPQRWKSEANFSVELTGAPDTNLGVSLDKDLVLAGDTGELGVLQRLRNVSGKTVQYSLTDRTICKGGGFVVLPLNRHSKFKAGWALTHVIGGRTIRDGEQPDAYGVSVSNGILVAQTGGDVTRLVADSDAEWIAYARGHLLFVKYYLYSPKADYRADGTSVEVYFDRHATELNPNSPVTSLPPGRSYVFPEKWLLLPLDKEVTSAADARKLVIKIPPSPFRK